MYVHSGLQKTSPHEYTMTVAVQIRHAGITGFKTGFHKSEKPSHFLQLA